MLKDAPAKASPFQFAPFLIDVCLGDIYIMTMFKTDCLLRRYIQAASQVSDSQETQPLYAAYMAATAPQIKRICPQTRVSSFSGSHFSFEQ